MGICSVLGSPSRQTWPEGMKLAAKMNFRFPQFSPTPLSQLIPQASPEAIKLMEDTMRYNPSKRPTCSQCLQYPFFKVGVQLTAANTNAAPKPKRMPATQLRVILPSPTPTRVIALLRQRLTST